MTKFPSKELIPAVEKLALTISKHAPLAIQSTIRAVNEGVEMDLIAGLKKEQVAFAELFESSDTREGLSAFNDKRSPEFKGK